MQALRAHLAFAYGDESLHFDCAVWRGRSNVRSAELVRIALPIVREPVWQVPVIGHFEVVEPAAATSGKEQGLSNLNVRNSRLRNRSM